MNSKLKLNSLLVHRLLLALVALLVLGALGGSYEIIGQLGNKSDTLTGLKAKHQALEQEQAYLIAAKKEIKQYSGLKQIAETIVPQDKDQAQTVREIVTLAQANNITLTGITFPSSTLGNTAVAGRPGAAATNTISLSQLTAVKGIPGVYVLPIQVVNSQQQNAVSYSSFYSFLTSLEQNRRTSLITGLNIQPISNGQINFSLTINEYIKPR